MIWRMRWWFRGHLARYYQWRLNRIVKRFEGLFGRVQYSTVPHIKVIVPVCMDKNLKPYYDVPVASWFSGDYLKENYPSDCFNEVALKGVSPGDVLKQFEEYLKVYVYCSGISTGKAMRNNLLVWRIKPEFNGSVFNSNIYSRLVVCGSNAKDQRIFK